jgi:hypothetical protein
LVARRARALTGALASAGGHPVFVHHLRSAATAGAGPRLPFAARRRGRGGHQLAHLVALLGREDLADLPAEVHHQLAHLLPRLLVAGHQPLAQLVRLRLHIGQDVLDLLLLIVGQAQLAHVFAEAFEERPRAGRRAVALDTRTWSAGAQLTHFLPQGLALLFGQRIVHGLAHVAEDAFDLIAALGGLHRVELVAQLFHLVAGRLQRGFDFRFLLVGEVEVFEDAAELFEHLGGILAGPASTVAARSAAEAPFFAGRGSRRRLFRPHDRRRDQRRQDDYRQCPSHRVHSHGCTSGSPSAFHAVRCYNARRGELLRWELP